MEIKITIPDSLKGLPSEFHAWEKFLQKITNRRTVGGVRYGPIKASTQFMTRMEMEMKAYKKTGNAEQLLNIAVYAFLESYAPENKKHHHDATVDSVTRSKLKVG